MIDLWLSVEKVALLQQASEGNKLPAQEQGLLTETIQNRLCQDWLNLFGALVESNDRIKRLTQTLQAAEHALRSYQYGNTAPYLAQEVADRIQSLLREYQEEP